MKINDLNFSKGKKYLLAQVEYCIGDDREMYNCSTGIKIKDEYSLQSIINFEFEEVLDTSVSYIEAISDCEINENEYSGVDCKEDTIFIRNGKVCSHNMNKSIVVLTQRWERIRGY